MSVCVCLFVCLLLFICFCLFVVLCCCLVKVVGVFQSAEISAFVLSVWLIHSRSLLVSAGTTHQRSWKRGKMVTFEDAN